MANPKKPRKNKFGNVWTPAGGRNFQSKWEAKRYLQLLHMQSKGLIHGLKPQRSFPLHAPGGEFICKYKADFTYMKNGRFIVEDAKGVETELFRIKKAWMLAEYGIELKLSFENDPSTW